MAQFIPRDDVPLEVIRKGALREGSRLWAKAPNAGQDATQPRPSRNASVQICRMGGVAILAIEVIQGEKCG